jgi:3-deoxy-7-phosphoheptulonate synthase
VSFEFIKKLPVPEEIKELYPISKQDKLFKKQRDAELRRILLGESNKLIVIVGPCSADYENSVMEYVLRLSELQEAVKEALLLIPRIYTNKPRTLCNGYMGMMLNPVPNQNVDALTGIIAARRLHLRVLSEAHLTSSDEMLYPEAFWYLFDVVSYAAIGARSSENQQHRLTASGVELPAGLKNPINGSLEVMLDSIQSVKLPQRFLYREWEVQTTGNTLAHGILRGGQHGTGITFSNYRQSDFEHIIELCDKREMVVPSIIVDCNHNNSDKDYNKQSEICFDVLKSRESFPFIKGLMLESYIEDGCQPVDGNIFGKSITDPCLGWEKTRQLIFKIADTT